MAAWTTPPMSPCIWFIAFVMSSFSMILPLITEIMAPLSSSSVTSCRAASFSVPLLPKKANFRQPVSNIHLARLLPSPPRQPTMKYVFVESKQRWTLRGIIWNCQRRPTSKTARLTGTRGCVSSNDTIAVLSAPSEDIYLKAFTIFVTLKSLIGRSLCAFEFRMKRRDSFSNLERHQYSDEILV